MKADLKSFLIRVIIKCDDNYSKTSASRVVIDRGVWFTIKRGRRDMSRR